MSLKGHDIFAVLDIGTYVSIAAVVGSLFSIFTVAVLKIAGSSLGKMVIFLAVFDIILGLSSLTVLLDLNELACSFRCFFGVLGWIGPIFWTCCFAHCLFKTVKFMDNNVPDIYFRKYWISSGIFGLVWGAVSVYMEYFQMQVREGQKRCYHNPTRPGFEPSQAILFQTPLFFGIFYSLGCYILVSEIS